MKLKKQTKQYITLVEMMIVMFLIAMITGVIAYNYTGALDKGKAFKTEAGIEKIKTALALEIATRGMEDYKTQGAAKFLEQSPLVKNPAELVRDGWGKPYDIDVKENSNGELEVSVISKNLNEYKNKH